MLGLVRVLVNLRFDYTDNISQKDYIPDREDREHIGSLCIVLQAPNRSEQIRSQQSTDHIPKVHSDRIRKNDQTDSESTSRQIPEVPSDRFRKYLQTYYESNFSQIPKVPLERF